MYTYWLCTLDFLMIRFVFVSKWRASGFRVSYSLYLVLCPDLAAIVDGGSCSRHLSNFFQMAETVLQNSARRNKSETHTHTNAWSIKLRCRFWPNRSGDMTVWRESDRERNLYPSPCIPTVSQMKNWNTITKYLQQSKLLLLLLLTEVSVSHSVSSSQLLL